MSWAKWMNGICLIWSSDRITSPSQPVGDDRNLNLSSQKSPTGRNLGGNRSVRRSGTTSRGIVLFAHAQVPSNSSSYHIRGNEMNCIGSIEYMVVFTSFARASSLTCGRISDLVGWSELRSQNILPYNSPCKMSKNGNTLQYYKILFLKNIWVYLRLVSFFHRYNQNKLSKRNRE